MSEERRVADAVPQPLPETVWRRFEDLLDRLMQNQSVFTTAPGARGRDYEDLTEEEKKAVDVFMLQIEEEVQKKATDLLRNEIRDKIAASGNIAKLLKMAKKKKPKLKRKRGCIFIQMGSGEPNDKIEEMLIGNTGV